MAGYLTKLRLKNRHIMLLRPLWLYVCLILGYWMLFGKDAEKTLFVIRYASLAFGALLIPQLVLHVKYSWDNARVVYDSSVGKLTVRRLGNHVAERTVATEDISDVTLFGSPSVVESRTRWFPWEEYYYWVVTCSNGERFVINSLSVDDISTILPTPATINQRRVKFFGWPPLPRE